jgi:uncharacterized protein (UPF0332 family)
MTGTKQDLVDYRLERARETLDDDRILAEKKKWNSAINRLYYAAYYAVIALLLHFDHKPTTHNGAKSLFSEHFIKTKVIPEEVGKLYSQLFTWRQKGDYVDLFNFSEEIVLPYIKPVEDLINQAETAIGR